jgi:hypothetical protein
LSALNQNIIKSNKPKTGINSENNTKEEDEIDNKNNQPEKIILEKNSIFQDQFKEADIEEKNIKPEVTSSKDIKIKTNIS